MVLWRPTRPFRINTQKRCPFHYRGLECKSRKSRNTWSNRQIWLYGTEWSRSKANRVLPREHTVHSKHPFPTTQEKTTNGHQQVLNTKVRLIIFFSAQDGEGCLLWPVHSFGKTLLAFALLHFVLQGQICLLLQVFLDFLLLHFSPL